ncbi:MAG: AAA family ATPase [Legionellales bacterium]|nr:AAA family ATPase [Legionellales bacterium]
MQYLKEYNKFNDDLKVTFGRAIEIAKDSRQKKITLECLLLALLDNQSIQVALHYCEVDANILKIELFKYLEKTKKVSQNNNEYFELDKSLQKVIQRAIFNTNMTADNKVKSLSIFIAIFSENRTKAAKTLQQVPFFRLRMLAYLDEVNANINKNNNLGNAKITNNAISALDTYCVNLNKKMLSNKASPLIKRDNEIIRLSQILNRRKKNNPLLLGEPGVGKTSIVEGLALQIAKGTGPRVLANSTIYSLDLGMLLSGTKYRGDFEKRLQNILDEISKDKNSILFIDEIHNIIGAGSTANQSTDLSNLLKPLLSSGELKCIGATTYKEYREKFTKDKALTRRFHNIEISEPSKNDTIDILNGMKKTFEEYYQIKIEKNAIISAVELSDRYILDKSFPDKALDIIDEVGAYYLTDDVSSNRLIEVSDIELAVSKMVNIPVKKMSESEKESLLNLEKNLKSSVFGQDDPIEKLSSTIKIAYSGLKDTRKPVSSVVHGNRWTFTIIIYN